ncbi:hypothetical protein PQR70_13960 [Paraburkholderia madseniana]|uniref:hypothetical protein n=1 Tax=Paraburkholderia madseniana TaxID=2599607 RepID=UPI0038BE173C
MLSTLHELGSNTMTRCTCSPARWAACAEAGSVYALSVFTIGFALGAIRVLLLVPRLGEVAAVLLETPFMLAASWKMSRWSAKKHGLLTDTAGTLVMGAIAFAVLLFAELATSVLCVNRTVADYFADFWSVPKAIGLVAQLCFASFPFLQASRNRIASSP